MSRILLVDDDDMSRSTIHKMLERAGYSVESTQDGNEVIRMYSQDGADLVVTDLIMPDKDGLEIIQELRRIDPKVRILAISGGGRVDANEYLAVARKFGAVEVLSKPFSRNDLRLAVETALGTAGPPEALA
jgi:two-component system, chemotaxis family, chemotaxis protein CheY